MVAWDNAVDWDDGTETRYEEHWGRVLADTEAAALEEAAAELLETSLGNDPA